MHFILATRTQKTLVKTLIKISPYYFPRHIHGNYFCRCFAASFSLLRAFERRTLQLRGRHAAAAGWTLNTVEPLLTVAAARSCCFLQRSNFFSLLIDGCLKYKNKESPKTGPRPGPRLNYDMKIVPKPEMQGSSQNYCILYNYIPFLNHIVSTLQVYI